MPYISTLHLDNIYTYTYTYTCTIHIDYTCMLPSLLDFSSCLVGFIDLCYIPYTTLHIHTLPTSLHLLTHTRLNMATMSLCPFNCAISSAVLPTYMTYTVHNILYHMIHIHIHIHIIDFITLLHFIHSMREYDIDI